MITPFKKPAEASLSAGRRNQYSGNKLRYVIEQVIANFKTWRITHTDYRRPIGTFSTTIQLLLLALTRSPE